MAIVDRSVLSASRRWVVKIGSALLTDNGRGLDIEAIQGWVKQLSWLIESGVELVLVSSGSVAAGMVRLNWSERPDSLHKLQAAAAVGQSGLVQAYEKSFGYYGVTTAQILLDHDDLSSRERYLNARSTVLTLMEMGVVPIVNENDTVVTDEIRFGDNDTLAALVANLIEADVLILMTDQDGMYTADPRNDPAAQLIEQASANDSALDAQAGDGGRLGRGGMVTKVRAARLAARSGAHTVIVGGRIDRALERLRAGEVLGTLLTASDKPQAARKRWLSGQLQTRGELILDDGAVRVLKERGSSLLSVGVSDVKGDFRRGELVSCLDEQGREVARGLVNYGSRDALRIAGQSTDAIESLLGYVDDEELIHRDNLVLL